MRDFMPKLDRYGDLSVQKNLKVSYCPCVLEVGGDSISEMICLCLEIDWEGEVIVYPL